MCLSVFMNQQIKPSYSVKRGVASVCYEEDDLKEQGPEYKQLKGASSLECLDSDSGEL